MVAPFCISGQHHVGGEASFTKSVSACKDRGVPFIPRAAAPMLSPTLSRLAIVFSITGVFAGGETCLAQSVDWPAYNGGRDGDHYSKLMQIDRANVHELKVAW